MKRAPIASASIATAILIGGTYLGLTRADQNETADAAQAAPSPSSSSPTAEPTRPADPLSRDLAVERTPSPASEKVTSTGSCGASFYHEPQGTANGETFDPEAMTAAHKSLPFNSRVRVTNPANGKSVIVRINDRGPYISGRCLDLSRASFAQIANLSQGVLKVVNYEVLGK